MSDKYMEDIDKLNESILDRFKKKDKETVPPKVSRKEALKKAFQIGDKLLSGEYKDIKQFVKKLSNSSASNNFINGSDEETLSVFIYNIDIKSTKDKNQLNLVDDFMDDLKSAINDIDRYNSYSYYNTEEDMDYGSINTTIGAPSSFKSNIQLIYYPLDKD